MIVNYSQNSKENSLVNDFNRKFDDYGSKEQSQPKKFAGFWIRFLARILDSIIFVPSSLLIFYLGKIFYLDVLGGEIQKADLGDITNIAALVLALIYDVGFLASKFQATPGKMMVRIYVATENGERLSIKRAFIRSFFSSMTSLVFGINFLIRIGFLIIFGISFLMTAFTKEKTALHDLICGTRVFYGEKN